MGTKRTLSADVVMPHLKPFPIRTVFRYERCPLQTASVTNGSRYAKNVSGTQIKNKKKKTKGGGKVYIMSLQQ